MAAYRLVIPTCLALLCAPLGGCAGFDSLGTASIAPEAGKALATGNLSDERDDLAVAKKHFRDRSFGLAEKHFRAAVEASSNNAEAWLGLAATHDQLGRFDLADKEYAQVEKKAGKSPELFNNRGYSYLLRGDLARARRDFTAAQRLDPENEFTRNNLRELNEKAAARG